MRLWQSASLIECLLSHYFIVLLQVPGEAEATQPQWEAKLRSSWAATPKTTRKVFCVLMIGGLLVGGHSFYDSSQEYAARRTFTGIR